MGPYGGPTRATEVRRRERGTLRLFDQIVGIILGYCGFFGVVFEVWCGFPQQAVFGALFSLSRADARVVDGTGGDHGHTSLHKISNHCKTGSFRGLL